MNRNAVTVWIVAAVLILGYAWAVRTYSPRFQPEPASVLVGMGCGPDRLTLAANEESAFPAECETIERVYIFEDDAESD